jgi:3-oxoacyl-[acyl-carrier-protein] synthase II
MSQSLSPDFGRRIVLTGSGVVTPFGDLQQSIEGVGARRSALAPVGAFDSSSFSEKRAGECTTFDARPWFRAPKSLKVADRRARLAVAAARMAFADAGLPPDSTPDAGVLIGTNAHDVQVEDVGRALGAPAGGDVRDVDYFGHRMLHKLPPLWLIVNLANMASAHVAIELRSQGPNSTITNDWISGLQAVGEAARWIAASDADLVIAGGADCGVLPLLYAALEKEGYFAGEAPTFVPGEGAAIFAVEELQHARDRGARILGEITGYASSSGDGALVRSMSRAIRESGSSQVDLICDAALFAHGRRDEETEAIDAVFGTPPERFECNSLTGFAMAASAPIALALAIAGAAPQQSILVNSLGALGQAASLTFMTGDPSETHP